MLLQKDNSLLLLIDVQEKLTPLVHDHQRLVTNCHWLLRVAQEMGVPILISEQYPKGLGPTIPTLNIFKTATNLMTKLTFSCTADPACLKMIEQSGRKQIVLLGIETHVCVLQTALGLLHQEFQVYVVVDAVSSRTALDKKIALKRMQQAGITLITREMAVFEWLHQSGTPLFKKISAEFLK